MEQARALMQCMQELPCMKEQGKTLKECLADEKDVSHCSLERKAYFECRRAQVDMRSRIRGPRS
jgi:cytochrome c oxidase assembly factor 5